MVGRSISLPQLKVAPSQMGPVGSGTITNGSCWKCGSCKDKNKHHKLPFQTKTTLTVTTETQWLASISFQKQLFQSENHLDKGQHMDSS